MQTLGDYLADYEAEHNFSRREFARRLHSSTDTLERMIEKHEPPTIKFLRSVSGYTGASLLYLLQISFPNEIPQPSTEGQRAGQIIDAMPEEKRKFYLEMIENAQLRIGKTSHDESEIQIVKKSKRKAGV